MPLGKPRNPSRYMIRLHSIIRAGFGIHTMGLEQATEQAAKLEARRFGYFRRDLLANPTHPTSKLFRKLLDAGATIRTKLVLAEAGWDVEVRIQKPKPKPLLNRKGDLEILLRLEESLE